MRTKQTARKSTGGCTPKVLEHKRAIKSPRNSQSNSNSNSQLRSGQMAVKTSKLGAKKTPAKTVSKRSAKPTAKPNRFKPSKAVAEIRKLQTTVNLLIPKLSFSRLVREITSYVASDMRWKLTAMEALQEATEYHLVQLFEDSQECAVHCKRVTIMDRDLRLVMRMRKSHNDYH
eukprot:TRINITY_DN962_c0_g1_i1.p1 TRINITY_DN962_c0_g1~~TRINITY_DN962_c0_g1_i1.p1  ORF type:complete len:174 (+),score=39.23 TRINITY_DN962_c0_g1_i1:95-616(+)